MEKEQKELYPVEYHFELWEEEDCNEIFVNCYHSRDSLNCEGGVYMFDGTWVYPDGRTEQW